MEYRIHRSEVNHISIFDPDGQGKTITSSQKIVTLQVGVGILCRVDTELVQVVEGMELKVFKVGHMIWRFAR
jgi:hypothetical protein